MQLTIAKKITLEAAGILFLGLFLTLTIYNGLHAVKQAMYEVTQVEEPTSVAAYEMEINAIGTGMGVLKYLETANPQSRQRVAKDEADFERFMTQYDRLTKTQRGKELGQKVGLLYREYRALGEETLMDKKDEQQARFAAVGELFASMDGLIDEKLQANIAQGGPDGPKKVAEATAMETDIAEVGAWLGNYLRIPKKEYKERIFDDANDFREELMHFQSLALTEEERRWAGELDKLFHQTLSLIQETLALNDALRENLTRFLNLRIEIDDVLDEEIQTPTLTDLDASKKKADHASAYVIQALVFLGPAFILFLLGVALFTVRMITRPIQELKEGTEAIAGGDLSYRLAPRGKDEFADLARHFNQMVAQLQASEEQLKKVNAELTHELTERKRLEAQLLLAQKMESIGHLAAGIAHEINTPMQYLGDNTRFLQATFQDLDKLLKKYTHLLQASQAGAVTPELVAEVEATTVETDSAYLVEEIPKAVEQSLKGIAQVSKIVRAMKEFSHPGSEDKTEIDLNRAIDTTLAVARNEWKYVAELVTDFDPALPPVPCFPGELNQVILNFIVNAAHAIADVVKDGSNGKGTITVSTRREGEWAEVRIRDTGPGIPEAIRPKVFDPFFTTKEVGKGTGQGLSIAHAVIVDKHRGVIAFETEEGKGTTFITRLPLAPTFLQKEDSSETARSLH